MALRSPKAPVAEPIANLRSPGKLSERPLVCWDALGLSSKMYCVYLCAKSDDDQKYDIHNSYSIR